MQLGFEYTTLCIDTNTHMYIQVYIYIYVLKYICIHIYKQFPCMAMPKCSHTHTREDFTAHSFHSNAASNVTYTPRTLVLSSSSQRNFLEKSLQKQRASIFYFIIWLLRNSNFLLFLSFLFFCYLFCASQIKHISGCKCV